MKKRLGLFLAALMLMGSMTASAVLDSTVGPNDVYFGYQKVDFENYSVNDKIITNGNNSKDNMFYGAVFGNNSTDTSFVIAGDETNKYAKITVDHTSGGYAQFKMYNRNDALNDEMDYFVLKADIKNGTTNDDAASYLAMVRNVRFNNGGKIFGIENNGFSGEKQLTNPHYWTECMFVANRKTGELKVIVNGEITNITGTGTSYDTADHFYGTQFMTQYSAAHEKDVICLDNMEMYGVKTAQNSVSVDLTSDEDNKSIVYADFTHPVNFAESNITVEGATLSSVSYADGKYKISVKDGNSGYSVKISGVTDVYGATCPDQTISVGAYVNKDVKYGYQKVDFETYTENGTVKNYNVGDTVITSTGNSVDNTVSATVTAPTSYNDFVIASDGNNKYLKVTDTRKWDATAEKYLGNFTFKMKNNNTTELNEDNVDYFVLKADVKNGDDLDSATPYLKLMRTIRLNNGGGLSTNVSSVTGAHTLTDKYGWNEYMFIGEKSTGKFYVVINGEIAGISGTSNDYKTQEKFYGLQFDTEYATNVLADNSTIYFDNMEMYGLKSGECGNECTVTTPTDSNKVEISFTHPTTLTTSDLSVMGNGDVSVANLTFENGKYVAEISGMEANSDYMITVAAVTSIFGAESLLTTKTFSTSTMALSKTYLAAAGDRFSGSEDFEHYSGLGTYVSADSTKVVAITDTAKGTDIKNIWSNSTGENGGVEYALVKEDDNTMLKISVPGEATVVEKDGKKCGEATTIFQPSDPNGFTDWTNLATGKVYVYSAKFKSGGENEAPFYLTSFGSGLSIYFGSGLAGFEGKTVKAFEPKTWVDFKYVIDCTGTTTKHYAIFNDVLIASKEVETYAIKSSSPRFAQIYATTGAENTSLYFDDIEIYTTLGTAKNLTAEIAKDNVKCGEGAYVKFNFPVATLEASSVIGAVKTEYLSDGTWNIAFANALSVGENKITLENITDIYGNTLESTELSFNVVSGGKFEGITGKSVSNGTVTVKTYNSGAKVENVNIAVAGYEGNKLTGIEVKKAATVGMGTDTFEFTKVGTATTYKAFVWDNNYAPLCEAK